MDKPPSWLGDPEELGCLMVVATGCLICIIFAIGKAIHG